MRSMRHWQQLLSWSTKQRTVYGDGGLDYVPRTTTTMSAWNQIVNA